MKEEKLFLECQTCGEVFDELTTAKQHEKEYLDCGYDGANYRIITED